MTWSYTEDFTNPKDQVRFHSGDTLKDDPLVSNEAIAFCLTEAGGNAYLAAALICDSLAKRFARYADKSVADEREALSQRSGLFADRAAELRARAAAGATNADGIIGAPPFVGGISRARQNAADTDPDVIPSGFRPGMFDAV